MWLYNNKSVSSIEDLPNPGNLFAFIYKITHFPTGKFYIGYKNFYSVTKRNFNKTELGTNSKLKDQPKIDKRLKKYEHITKESAWKTYYGSNDLLKADVITLGKHMFTREMIALAYSQKERTYLEIEHQILNNVLRSQNCYNDNISGHFFRKDLIKQ